ncbi:hypothetical protein M404DRAFT_137710, partial [Pisolithus tinctorius Marx 270]
MAVGYLLLQIREDSKHYPSRFGSIAFNERESRYSQVKLELFSLFCVLRDICNHIFGVKDLAVEVDAKYIKGMINNPDLQLNATINRWIAGILLFKFKLIHVLAEKHRGLDGLLRRPRANKDPEPEDDYEDWIDEVGSFAVKLLNPHRKVVEPNLGWIPYIGKQRSERSSEVTKNQMVLSQASGMDATADIEIPRTEKGKRQDKWLEVVHKFLEDQQRLPGMLDLDLNVLIKYVARFFLKNRELWHQELRGQHQVVPAYEKCLELMKQAHDDLGHKGVF